MRILIFTEGTLIMHSGARGCIREAIVKQVKAGTDPSIHNWSTYIPIGAAVEKLQKWKSQGARILYLTSRVRPLEVKDIKGALKNHGFPNGWVLFRQQGEEYKDVVEKALPDVLVEDDCESIGGREKLTIANIDPALKTKIKSVIVKEFEGIDHLPDDISNLRLQ